MTFNDLDPSSLDGAIVRKHNDLIEAHYQIPSLQEQRVIFMLLAQVKPDDEDFKGYRLTVADFAKLVGINNKNIYAEMSEITRSLRNREISIKRGKSFFHTGWLSSSEYIHGSGYVELCFDPKLKPYLLQLKSHFTQYKLEAILQFKSVYAIRLYEMLKKEAFKARVDADSKTKRFEVKYTLGEMRELFGIEDKQYKLFADFKRFTIEPAVTEITDKTDLNIDEVVYGKTGRAVSRVLFRVEHREKKETETLKTSLLEQQPDPEDTEKATLIAKLQTLGYSLESAIRDVNQYGIERVEKNRAYAVAMHETGQVNNIPAYLSKAIENDWGGAWEQVLEEKKAKAERNQQEAEEKEKQQAKTAQAKEDAAAILSARRLAELSGDPIENFLPKHLQEELKKIKTM